ncbi:MAG: glycosyltransferase family 4 protein [Bacteroidales bacterium]|nr:glycosyltransferase family 4 protein [Bacteroidales bacterium]
MKKVLRISTIPLSLDILLKGQLRMLAEHYEVVAVSSPGPELQKVAEREGVRTVALPMERRISLWKDLKSLVGMIRLIRKERPDMIHSLTPKAGLLSMLAGWLCGVPVRMHTFTGLVFPTTTGWKQKLLILTDRITCACATYVNPEGLGVKRDMERYHITNKPLHIIGSGNISGIDMAYFSRSEEVLEKAADYRDEKRFTFCFVGRMVGDKGINELVCAFREIYEKHPEVRLVLVGPFEEKLDPVLPETKEQILHHPGIRFMDWQSDVRPFLAASDVFVFPSYREGFPNVVIQAGAFDLPCIVTDINGSNEIIVHGENGVIIPPRDKEALQTAMLRMIEHPEERLRLAQNARRMIAERYEQKQLWRALLNVYESLNYNASLF